MKTFSFWILILTLFVYGTEQVPDLLILENDTLYLQYFPLQNDSLEYSPFISTNSANWRGYQAIYKVEDKKLMLTAINVDPLYKPSKTIFGFDISVLLGFRPKSEYNLKKIAKKNKLPWDQSKKAIHCSWESNDLILNHSPYYWLDEKDSKGPVYLIDREYSGADSSASTILSFENGVLIEDNLEILIDD